MMNDAFAKVKSCFGQYEAWDCSWHCKGCIIKEECEQQKKSEQNEENDDE